MKKLGKKLRSWCICLICFLPKPKRGVWICIWDTSHGMEWAWTGKETFSRQNWASQELYLMDLLQSGQATGGRTSLNLIQQALPHLVPLLTETLTKRQSEDDDDTWNLAMAAGTCLALVAQVVGDGCVDLVLQFVTANFTNNDWKFREAAVLAYGSIMEGPTSEKMRPMVEQSLSSLVMALQDPSVAVRDTIAWTLGRIAQFHPAIVPVKQLMPLLCEKLRDVPRVSANICWNVQVLAEAQSAGPYPDTTVLSEFFTAIAMALLEVVARPDADERQLRMAGYNALSVLVSKAGNDCLGHMQALTQEMLKHLQESYKSMDRECELQGYICGVLTSLVSRLRDKVAPLADQIMSEALKVISAYQQVRGGAQVLHEEALLLIVALANAAGSGFERFMPHFAPHLTVGLQNYEEIQVCLTTTRMVGDLCTALEGKVAKYCDMILEILYTNLKNPAVDRKIKAAVMTCFGDIAMAITGDFEKYLGPVVQMLREASSTRLADGPADSEEWIEYLNSLREGVLEAYSGIIHGLKESNKLPLFKEHVNTVLMLVKEISEDQTSQMPVIKAAVGVVGDLILVFQTELAAYVGKAPFLSNLVQIAIRSQEPKLLQNANWLQTMLVRFGGWCFRAAQDWVRWEGHFHCQRQISTVRCGLSSWHARRHAMTYVAFFDLCRHHLICRIVVPRNGSLHLIIISRLLSHVCPLPHFAWEDVKRSRFYHEIGWNWCMFMVSVPRCLLAIAVHKQSQTARASATWRSEAFVILFGISLFFQAEAWEWGSMCRGFVSHSSFSDETWYKHTDAPSRFHSLMWRYASTCGIRVLWG